jgi:hypothetical protein
MEENKIGLVSIKKLNGEPSLEDKTFIIPSYQRGYRWSRLQIMDLLEDIREYDEATDGSFYCLQPLVVKKKEDKWNIIDGQQRLTTIYLILKELNEPLFKLEYEREKYLDTLESISDAEKRITINQTKDELDKEINSRWETFISKDKTKDKIELYYLFQAKLIIFSWIESKTETEKNSFKKKLLENTKLIWYDIGEAEEHRLFENLNSGKIELTNAELIKALFLNNTGHQSNDKEIKQSRIADKFDQIERALREDDFWYFLAGNKEKSSSCINLLFDLMLDTDEKTNDYPKHEQFRTFFYFKDKILYNNKKHLSDIDSYKQAKKEWENVQKVFNTLEGWYKDSTTYNLVGYLRALKKPIELSKIYGIYKKSTEKSAYINELKTRCKASINFDNNKYLNLLFDRNKPEIRNLLLLLNIAALLQKPDEKARFSFTSFHKYNWDVEHISPQNPKNDQEMLKALKKIAKLPDDLISLKDYLEKEERTDDDKTEIEMIKEKYFASADSKTNNVMELYNLTLLSEHDNRGIGNKFFFEKRAQLKEYFQNGSFIPPCSMNVFVKFYTDNPEQLLFWDEKDREAYNKAIEEAINNFF